MRETYLDEKVAQVLSPLQFSEQKIDLMYRAAKERIDADSEYLNRSLDTLVKQLGSLKTKENKLLDTFLADQISKEIYDVKILEIHNNRISLEKQINDMRSKQSVSTLEPIKKIFMQGSRAVADYLKAPDAEKRNIVSELLWNLSVKDRKIAQVSYRSPYDILAKSPKTGDISILCREGESNSHGFLRTILSRVRLPIPPSRQSSKCRRKPAENQFYDLDLQAPAVQYWP